MNGHLCLFPNIRITPANQHIIQATLLNRMHIQLFSNLRSMVELSDEVARLELAKTWL
jgi:hypothetical protein